MFRKFKEPDIPHPRALPEVNLRRSTIAHVIFTYANLTIVIVQGFLFTPLYLRFVDAELYGAWLATGNIVGWLSAVDPGIGALAQQRMAHAFGARNANSMTAELRGALLVGAGIAVLPLIVLPFIDIAPRVVGLSHASSPMLVDAFRLAIASLPVVVLSHVGTGLNQGLQRTTFVGIVTLCGGLAGLATSLGLLFAGFGLAAIAAGNLARALVVLIGNLLGLIAFRVKYLPAVSDGNGVGELMRSLSHLSLLRGAMVALDSTESLIAATVIGPQQAASLALSSKAMEPVRLIYSRVAIAAAPAISHLVGRGQFSSIEQLALHWGNVSRLLLGPLIILFVTQNEAFVSLWVGHELFAGHGTTLLVGLSVASTLMTGAGSNLLFAAGAARDLAKITATEAVLRVSSQVLGAWLFGVAGIPAASLLVSVAYAGRAQVAVARTILPTATSVGMAWRTTALVLTVAATLSYPLAFAIRPAASWNELAAMSGLVGTVAAIVLLGSSPTARMSAQALVWRRQL